MTKECLVIKTIRPHEITLFFSFRKGMCLQVLPSKFCLVIDILISEHLDSLLGSQQIILLLYPLMTKLFGKIITLKR